jgi:transposase
MARDLDLEATIAEKWVAVEPVLDERGRRLWAAAESRAIGWGGDSLVSSATGLSRPTIRAGRREIEAGIEGNGWIRRAGAGRPRVDSSQPGLKDALEALVDPVTRGDPCSALRWTCKSRAKLAAALVKSGWTVSSTTVGRLLHELGYSLQSMRKTREGASHPDRNAQFEHINATAEDCLRRDQPVISVDTKKKELVGEFRNSGREWQPKGKPEKALVHDFPQDSSGKAIPYGIYDMGRNEGWVNVGRDHDTPAFAVASIRRWWQSMGRKAYATASELFITADAGGSNGYRSRAWKHELQRFADETGLVVRVSHFPPGTSKWNKIEHRLFCHITQNWRGKPLNSFETIVDLIGHTRTAAGLRVKAKIDKRNYPKGVQITKEQMESLSLHRHTFQGDWNYELRPRIDSTRAGEPDQLEN